MPCLVPITPEDKAVRVLGTRSSAVGFRERVEQKLEICQTVQVGFRGIFVTQGFVDELFGPLILHMGPTLLERVVFSGCSDDTKAILNVVFASRLRDFSTNWSEQPGAGIVGSSDKDDRDFAVILSSTALTDGVLTLRPLQRDDRDPMYAAVMESIAEVSRWLPWCHPGYSIGETEAFIESCITAWTQQTHFPFAIFDASTGQYLGGTGVNHIDRQNRQGSVGYWVRTGATRRGIAPKAVRLLARFAFDTLQLSRLEIFARPDNAPSRRVAEKSGAKFEAMARNRVVQHGRAYDAALYSLIPSDLVTTTAPGVG